LQRILKLFSVILHFSVEFIPHVWEVLLVAASDTQPEPTKMNSIATKINREARIICNRYIQVLEQGNEPSTLRSQIEHSKYDILSSINDSRQDVIFTMLDL
jgi:hypothetical protein